MLPFSALPFHCLTSQSFASPFPRLSEPVRFVVRASCHFFAFAILCSAERFYSVSTLRSSTPCLGVSAGIVSAPIYSVSAPVPAIPYLTLLFTSLPFIFSTKLLCALPFLSLCMSDQIHIRSTHFRLFSHLFQSILLRFSSFLHKTRPLPASLSRCNSSLFRIVSCPCCFRSARFWTLYLCCFSMFFHFATQLIVSLFLCISVLFYSYSIHFLASLFRRSLAHLTATLSLATSVLFPALSDLFISCQFRFAAYLRSSFVALFTIQGVLMPCLLSAF